MPGLFLWREIGERVGYRTVALISGVLSGVGVLYWWFLPHGNFRAFFTMLIFARVFFGMVSAGSMLAISTLNMNVAPEKHRSTYFAQVTTVIALASAAGIYCGRFIYLPAQPFCGGEFFGPKGPGELRGKVGRVTPVAAGRDEISAERLWTVSEELTSVSYPLPSPAAA